jgi:hypothetical protein
MLADLLERPLPARSVSTARGAIAGCCSVQVLPPPFMVILA